MKTADFFFNLPDHLIAQYPPAERGRSRLMVLDRAGGCREHRMVKDLPGLLEKGTLLVFNNSKVRKARIFGVSRDTGAGVEFLLLDKAHGDSAWKVMAQRSKRRRPGSRYVFDDGTEGEIEAAEGEFRILRFDRPVDDSWLDLYGHIPLPPYVKRDDTGAASDRYQTVYAEKIGSTAAPTAGLHFTAGLLGELEQAGM